MTTRFEFDAVELPPECIELRKEVRAFLRQEIDAGTFSPQSGRTHNAADFARRNGIIEIQISLTHARDYAAANAIAISGS